VLKKHQPEVVRYFLLSSHYRSALNYSDESLILANRSLMRLYQSLKDIELFEKTEKNLKPFGFSTHPLKRLHQRFEKRRHISDEMLELFEETRSIPSVLKRYSSLEDGRIL
jgi:cysteinyl-tRNA synthetase